MSRCAVYKAVLEAMVSPTRSNTLMQGNWEKENKRSSLSWSMLHFLPD